MVLYWYHPEGIRVTISGKAGSDARPYQINEVQKALALVKK